MSSEFRFVFDASLTITSFYLNDEDDLSPTHGNSSAVHVENRSWEYIGNSHIGANYGSFFYSEANFSSLVQLFKCQKQYVMVDTKKNIVYPIGHQGSMNLMKEKVFPSWLKENTVYCIDHKTKTVILTIAGYSYKDMLMSWVCRLQKLSIENFIVYALDKETYQFSILQGIPVFTDPIAPSNVSFDDCHFGTKCFQRVTKVKSRIVLKILKLGYNVLLSDVDVYWFKNPVPLLHSFGPAVLAVQDLFPNGAYQELRREKNVKEAGLKKGSYIIHNNWISGRLKKLERQVLSGLWEYDPATTMCLRCRHGGHQEVYRHAVPASQLMRKYPGMCVARPEVFKVPHQSVLWHEEILVPGHRYILISFRHVEKLKRKLLEEEKNKEANGVVLETKTRSPSGHKDKVKVPNGVAGHETLETKITNGLSHKENEKMKETNGVSGQGVLETRLTVSPKDKVNTEETVDTNMEGSLGEGGVEESFSSARDFYVPKEKSTSTTTRPPRRKGIKGKKPFEAPLPKQRLYNRGLGWQPSLPSVKELSP
ncbi:hypothetical protein glysoja_042161 [Glycine soja]|uniref:Nucleotide-diphospho-sugar transferase domain-containing protein n=1 Tax=Glycine soja TaxID=3848 RepID=A0A0B2RRH3_GLYSO|nr:hypothetical protein glysoja_042161 [Glycine soja]